MKSASNTITKDQLALMTGATAAKAKRDAKPQYQLKKKQCESPGCTATFDSFPGAYHPCCSFECFALAEIAKAEPDFFTAAMRAWIFNEVITPHGV